MEIEVVSRLVKRVKVTQSTISIETLSEIIESGVVTMKVGLRPAGQMSDKSVTWSGGT